jgi:uncharacterized membrane protein (DUF2068 family)
MTNTRPFVVTLLIVLFVIGSVASLIAVITLAYPGTQLDAAWRVNPQTHAGLTRIRSWSVVLMSAVFVACLFTAIGLSRHLEWGYWLAMVMLIANLTTDVINVIVGTERRAIVGIPIVLTLLLYLSRRKTREYFTQEDRL